MWKPCSYCDATGQVTGLIENEPFTCPHCGGHKKQPVAGVHWFKQFSTERIASLTQEPDGQWRVTTYLPDGPEGHQIEGSYYIMKELRHYTEYPSAAKLLDAWTRTETWANGIDKMTWLALEWTLREYVNYDLIASLWQMPIQERVREAFLLKRIFCPHESIW